jgi:hypothetical protein
MQVKKNNQEPGSHTVQSLNNLNSFSFRKQGARWLIEFPLQNGNKREMISEMISGNDDIIRFMAGNKAVLQIMIDRMPFEGSDELELLELCTNSKGGGYYLMHTFNGRILNRKVWLADVILLILGEMPERLYVRKLN